MQPWPILGPAVMTQHCFCFCFCFFVLFPPCPRVGVIGQLWLIEYRYYAIASVTYRVYIVWYYATASVSCNSTTATATERQCSAAAFRKAAGEIHTQMQQYNTPSSRRAGKPHGAAHPVATGPFDGACMRAIVVPRSTPFTTERGRPDISAGALPKHAPRQLSKKLRHLGFPRRHPRQYWR